ncbi:MAG: CAP domain-containing protein [Desulfobaccales bacterium]
MQSMMLKLMRVGLMAALVFAVTLLALPRLSQAFTPPVVQKPAVLPPPGVRHLPQVEDLVFEMTNRARRAKGLPPLVKDEELTQVARAYSDDMLVRRFFDHTTPDGISFDERISGRYSHRVITLGENIWTALGYNPANIHRVAQEIVDDWMSSPGHRANILDPDFTHLGVGVSARHRTVLATQEFVGRFKAFSFRDLITEAQ